MKKFCKKCLTIFLVILSFVLIVFSFYMKKYYPTVKMEQLIYHLMVPIGNSPSEIFTSAIKLCAPYFIVPLIFFFVLDYINKYLDIIIHIFKKKYNISSFFFKKGWILSIILFIISFDYLIYSLNGFSYIRNLFSNSNFYEDNYVNPKNALISFPEEKKNLIVIYVESLESTDFSKENNGYRSESLIPKFRKNSC